MKTKFHFIVLVLLLSFSQLPGTDNSPKREFRAAWISTVVNIDWPSTPGLSAENQKQELITILDYLKKANLNAVVFQVRPACDAMYASTIEPWSYWLTGEQGKANDGNFDPLHFAIEEAHKRGMELHAWFNPYRVSRESWNLKLDENHIAKKNPHWVLNVDGNEILDPGLPEVREYITLIIEDVVSRYDVDAIHFDDYFYLEGISTQDAQTFNDYPNGYTDLGDWRRNNVNQLMRDVYSKIQSINPDVKFGQSPPGIWKTGVPDGIFGRNTYSSIYCDAPTWLEEQVIDYLAPQLYWKIEGPQDYSKLMPWWVSQSNGRHIYPGLAFYRVGESSFDKTQLGQMISLNRDNEGNQGQIFFTAHNFQDNLGNNTDTLENNYFKYKSFVPSMSWRDQIAPNAPSNLRFGRVEGTGTTGLTWDKSSSEDAKWYALYRFSESSYTQDDFDNPANIYDVTSNNYFIIDESFPSEKAYYVVTALDRNHNESSGSSAFEFTPGLTLPDVPELLLPLADAQNLTDSIKLEWNYADNANYYSVEVSENIDFSTFAINKSALLDTMYVITGLKGETQYFWRTKALNNAGESSYSEIRSFRTGYPAAPGLTLPQDETIDIALMPSYSWEERNDAISYQFQLFKDIGSNSDNLLIDTVLTTNEFQQEFELDPSTVYSFRVRVTNEYGTGLYSEINKFKTLSRLPDMPMLVSPLNNDNNVSETVILVWNQSKYALSYDVQVATDIDFSNIFFTDNIVNDTSASVQSLKGDTQYFWRARAVNNSGKSEYTNTYSFETGFPITPQLVSPTDLELNVAIRPNFQWTESKSAENYQVQIALDNTFSDNKMILDTLVNESSFISKELKHETIYSWRVKGKNSLSESDWSTIYRFKTTDITSVIDNKIPLEYKLHQNYPNPFNPSTTIKFDLPETNFVSLKIYNILGQQVAIIVNEELKAGRYKYSFDSKGELPSGIYFCILKTDKRTDIKKMILLK